MKNKLLKNKYIVRIFWIVILGIIWEVIALSGWVNPLIFPSITRVLEALYQSTISGEIIGETLYSLNLILRSLAIGIAIAVLLSLLAIKSEVFEGLVETLLAIAHPLPGIALLPLIILWLGTGTNSIIFIIVHSVAWPMVLNLLTGFKSIPKIYKQLGENYELSTMEIIWNILIPASFPYFLAGIKIGWARAWRALISSEMIFGAAGGIGGLGWFIFKKRVFMDTAGMYSGLLIIVLIGILVDDILFSKLEERTVKKWGMSV
ncbi:ABC transporter permease [Wukongibacter sp. M2B1]|uniref:ABC transporter permease n=1 Tax=Wukongibacter sp. M2B1 TaxID=3088895 RepID=UPI003D7BC279